MNKVIVIVVGLLAIGMLSWRPWVRGRTAVHGFYRFFAFCALLALIVMNLDFWSRDPGSIHQIFSWLLLSVSLLLALPAFYFLIKIGRPTPSAPESPTMGFENTSRLVTVGIYRFLRHPMYASLIYLVWGVSLKHVALGPIALAVVATGFLMATAKVEERENIKRFGEEYRAYMTRTRRFVPFLF